MTVIETGNRVEAEAEIGVEAEEDFVVEVGVEGVSVVGKIEVVRTVEVLSRKC